MHVLEDAVRRHSKREVAVAEAKLLVDDDDVIVPLPVFDDCRILWHTDIDIRSVVDAVAEDQSR